MPINTAFSYRPLIEKSDLEILFSISEYNSNQAKSEFFCRYSSYLLQICRKRCQGFDSGLELADDIFQNTIIKAFNGSGSLYRKIFKTDTNVDKTIKAWLAVIARNELREFLRMNPDEKQLADPYRKKSDSVEIGYDPEEDKVEDKNNEETLTIEKQKLDAGLASLSDKERHVLMVYMEYYDPERPKRHLPDNVIAELCNKYDTNSTNLRKIKSRALKKLMKASE